MFQQPRPGRPVGGGVLWLLWRHHVGGGPGALRPPQHLHRGGLPGDRQHRSLPGPRLHPRPGDADGRVQNYLSQQWIESIIYLCGQLNLKVTFLSFVCYNWGFHNLFYWKSNCSILFLPIFQHRTLLIIYLYTTYICVDSFLWNKNIYMLYLKGNYFA